MAQQPAANSLPVVIASDQPAIPVTGVASGGTFYTDGAAAVANPVGTEQIWKEGSTNRAVSDVKPLPIQRASATDGSQKTQIVSGANILLVDAAGNALIRGTSAEVASLSGSGTGDLLPSTDVSAYKWVSLQVLTIASATITFQVSNDNVTWYTTLAYAVGSGAVATSTAALGIWCIPVTTRYLRAHHTVSGTSTGVAEFFTLAPWWAASIQAVSQNGSWVLGTSAVSNANLNYHVVSAATTNAVSVKGSAAQLYDYDIFNVAAYPVYVKLFNKATAPTVGTDTPLRTIGVPAGGTKNFHSTVAIPFGTGLALAIVKDIADLGATAVAAADCVVDLGYK